MRLKMPAERLREDSVKSDISNGICVPTIVDNVIDEIPATGVNIPHNNSKSRLAILKRSTTEKRKKADDPFRFQGDGVDFKAKLIGIREVAEARGDQLCSEAMQLAKSAVKASGQHKQRIALNISLDGLKIRDEKSTQLLYQFPVSRISFIARDTTDTRAFGFIYGASDSSHKFYGIKTAQTADHAVLSIRDMFQIVFEMKKRQIEQVKLKQEEEKIDHNANGVSTTKYDGGVAVADLLDLESELHNLEEGVNQLKNIADSDDWPMGDNNSFPDPRQFGNNDDYRSITNGNGATLFPPQSDVPSFLNDSLSSGTNSSGDPFGDSFNPRATPITTTSNWNGFNTGAVIQPPPSVHQANGNGLVLASTNPFASIVFPKPSSPFIDHQHPTPLFANDIWIPEPTLQPLQLVTNNNQQAKLQSSSTAVVSSLEDAFSKLVDLDSLTANKYVGTGKENPFVSVLNPPKPTLRAMVGKDPMMTVPTTVRSTGVDPFNDDFFH